MMITKKQWNKLHPKLWEYEIFSSKESCKHGEKRLKFVITSYNCCSIFLICDECGQSTKEEDIESYLEWLKAGRFADHLSECCDAYIVKDKDKRYYCGVCFREVEYYKCDLCDSDGMVRDWDKYRKCPECGGTKRVQL